MEDREREALGRGGTTPGVTNPAANTGASGGGLAVPPDAALQNSGALGDTGSMDDTDSSSAAIDDDVMASDRSVAGGASAPAASGDGDDETEGDVPTGGLSSTVTIGGTPSGAAQTGSGERGL